MNYTKTAAKGVAYGLLFNALAGLTAYLTRLVLARSMTPAEYGLFYAVFTLVTFFLFFRDLGFDQALVKYIAEWRATGKYGEIKAAILSVVLIQLISSVILSIAAFFLADLLAAHYFGNPNAALMLKVLIVYIIFSVGIRTTRGLFQGIQEMGLFTSTDFMKNVIALGASIVFVALGFRFFAPVIAYAILGPVFLLIYLPFLIKKFQFLKGHPMAQLRPVATQLFSFGILVFATAAGSKIISQIDTLIMTYSRSLAEVGIYNVVLPSAMMLLEMGTAAASAAFPMVSELWAKNDRKRLAEGVRLIHKYAFLFTIPIIFTLISFAQLFIEAFFGAEYGSGAVALQILLVGVFFFIVAMIEMNVLAGMGKPSEVTKIVMIGAFTNLVLNIIFIPLYGMSGAAATTTLSYGIALILSTRKVTKYMELKFPVKEWLKMAAAALCFTGTAVLIKAMLDTSQWIELISAMIGAGIVYAAIIYLLGMANIAEIKMYVQLAWRKNE